WMYDSRLGRRWNVDPKPNPSFSDYATFAGNPIFYRDPMGDTVEVKYGGFLCIGRKTARYDETTQKFYNSEGGEITTDNKFYNKINKGVADINKGLEGRAMLEELAKDENLITIKRGYAIRKGYGDSFKPSGFGKWKKSSNGTGTGGTLRVQLRNEVQASISIAHERGAWNCSY
ncbi:MAG: hypothetical protein ACOCWG_04865, partial [bacterium]